MNPKSEIDYTELRDYAWKYFQFHASQRLTIFNFYILISTLVSTGYFLAIRFVPVFAVIFGILLIIFSFVFWKLDRRNSQLIKNSENALKFIESKDFDEKKDSSVNILNIFTYEEAHTLELKKKERKWSLYRLLSYSICFNIVFITFSILGVIAIICAIIYLIYIN